jgi:hypothetical protein
MLITSSYNEKTKTEKCWFKSSNVFYSEFVEDEYKNEGNLYVTFNNGATYKYKNVQLTPDYVMFKHGGLEGSHGKALNTHIKPKYEFERISDRNINDLMYEKSQQEILNRKNTCFISGHRNITEVEFEKYKTAISSIISENPSTCFVIGDYYGVDIMAQNYLVDDLGVSPEQVTVYHMFDSPRNINPKITRLVGGFESDEERDAAMTNNSGFDIAFVRNNTELSGTAQNILRRNIL